MDTPITDTRGLRTLLGLAVAGVAALLFGLVWDARLHAADPGLAASEGVFSLSNPGHMLAALGVLLVTIGIAGAAWIAWFRDQAPTVRAAGALVAAIGTLATGATMVAASAEAQHSHGDDVDAAVQEGAGHHQPRDYDALWDDASAEERAAATKLVEDTKVATERYRNYDEALRAGYRPNARAGERATHHPNPSLMRDGKVLDPSAPESLMYWTAPDGGKVLVGVVFKAASGEKAPAPGGELTAWHTHAGEKKCYPALDADCPDDAMKMLHVFFFDGVQDPFADTMAAAAGGRAEFARAMKDSMNHEGERSRAAATRLPEVLFTT